MCSTEVPKRLKPLLDFYHVLYHPQFVLEHILEVPARVCQQWLEMRGVPATGVPLTPQPVIVFGLTVYSTINHELYII